MIELTHDRPLVINPHEQNPRGPITRLLVETVTVPSRLVRLTCLQTNGTGVAVALSEWELLRLIDALASQVVGDDLAAVAQAVQGYVDAEAQRLARWNAANERKPEP